MIQAGRLRPACLEVSIHLSFAKFKWETLACISLSSYRSLGCYPSSSPNLFSPGPCNSLPQLSLPLPISLSIHLKTHLIIIFFYSSIVDLQCCVSFRDTTKRFSYTYTHIYFFRFFSGTGYYKILNIVPCVIW